MTHFAEMPESSGDLHSPKIVACHCKHCSEQKEFKLETWESHCGGYEDYKYTCLTCGHGFWVEGADA